MDGAFPSEKGQPFDAMSAGGGYGRGGAAPRRGFRGTAENAKTKLCTRWQQGDCRFGDRCNFAHGDDELRKLPPREDGGRGFPGPGRGGPGRGGYGGYNGGGRGGPAPYGGGRGRGYDEYGYGGGGGYGGPQGGGYGAPQGGAYGGHPGERPAGAQGGYGAPAAGAAGEAGAPRMGAAGAPAGGQMPEDVWAANGYPVQGPNGWVMYKVKETGEPYYHNHRTNSTQWERPSDWPAN